MCGPRTGAVAIDQRDDTKRRVAPARIGGLATDQKDDGPVVGRIGRHGQPRHVEFVTEELGGGRRRARGRVVQDTAATHETKVGPRRDAKSRILIMILE